MAIRMWYSTLPTFPNQITCDSLFARRLRGKRLMLSCSRMSANPRLRYTHSIFW